MSRLLSADPRLPHTLLLFYSSTRKVHRTHECSDCGRYFRNAHDLKQHRQVHRPRTVPCPVCGQLYKSSTDAVLHIETGYCHGCRGRDNARRAVYGMVSQHAAHLTSRGQQMLEYGSSGGGTGWQASGANYRCQGCHREFHSLGSLMQHQDARPQCKLGSSTLALGWQ